ncbi:MAG TPA: protein-tyrosine-phosphatase [Stellaceae bacterium]|nr:protein-tyrosine-phosphatase [Stellaceae bacterium]
MTDRQYRFNLTICGIAELDEYCDGKITHLLSISDPDWIEAAAVAAFAPERRLALRFHDIIEPAPDRLAPGREDVARLLAFGRELAAGDHLLVHCHAGISRSTAAAALILAQADPARPACEVLQLVTELRPRAWPNLRILEFGDDLLGRGGEIPAAAGLVYRRVLARDPAFGDMIIAGGRGREVGAALSSPAPAQTG